MNDEIKKDWEKLLNFDILKQTLMLGSMYITIYEQLEDTIIDRIKDFYTFGGMESLERYNEEVLTQNKKRSPLWDSLERLKENNAINDKEFQEFKKVLIKNEKRSSLKASLEWLKEANAINDKDFQVFKIIRKHRNFLTHELVNVIMSHKHDIDVDLFKEMLDFFRKIEIWFIRNMEDISNEVKDEDIRSGNIIFLGYMLSTVLDLEETEKKQ